MECFYILKLLHELMMLIMWNNIKLLMGDTVIQGYTYLGSLCCMLDSLNLLQICTQREGWSYGKQHLLINKGVY
jgi:hypothetical protein